MKHDLQFILKHSLKRILLLTIFLSLGYLNAQAQYGPNDDLDGDSIINSVDLDDDNDGILDTEENPFDCPDLNDPNFNNFTFDNGSVSSGVMTFTNIGTQGTDTIDMIVSKILPNPGGGYTLLPQGNGDCSGANGFAVNQARNGNKVLIEFFISGTNTPVTLTNFALLMDDFDLTEILTFTKTGFIGYSANPSLNPTVTNNLADIRFESGNNNADDFAVYYQNVSSFIIDFGSTTDRNYCFSSVGTIPGQTCVLTDSNAVGNRDTDGDGILDHQDLDSDNDGCPDALEGGLSFGISSIMNDTLTGGVDTNGVPVVVMGGQPIGTSADSTIMSTACFSTNPDINVTTVNTPVPGDLSTNDVFGIDSVAYGTPVPVVGNPDGSTPIINPDGSYTFTSPVPGTFVFMVPVCAEGVVVPNCPEELLTINVTDPADTTSPPIANTDISTVDSGGTVNIPVLSNDDPTNPGGMLDNPSVTTPPSNGTATPQPDGTIDYTPNPGFTGVDTFYYAVCDTTLLPAACDTAEVIVTVNPSNAPNTIAASDDYASTPSETPVSGNVMTNDIDPDGDPTTTTAQTTTTPEGILVLGTDGSYTFTPAPGFSGPVNYPYEVCDNQGNCTMATLYLVVDEPIETNPDINVTTVNTPVTGDVSTNDENVPAGTTYGSPNAVLGNPDGSMPTINPDGSYTFTSPVPGVFEFMVPICGPDEVVPNCPVELLTITVLDTASNTNTPVANTDLGVTPLNTPITLNTLANDGAGNPEEILDPSSVTIVGLPGNGLVTVDNVTGNTTYTPNTGFVGTDTIQYQVCDTSMPAQCETAYQIITVLPAGADNVTSATDDFNTTEQGTPVSDNVLTNDTDPENNGQSVVPQTTTITGVGTLVLDSTGAYTFTPDPTYAGPANFPYQVCDDGSPQACAEATLYLLVAGPSFVALPIELISFEGFAQRDINLLQWSVAQELNCASYRLYHSVNAVDFTLLTDIPANNLKNSTYKFQHESPILGNNFYKLVSVDLDAKSYDHSIINVKRSYVGSSDLSIYPNPVSSVLNINYKGETIESASFIISDISGKTIRTENVILNTDFFERKINLDNLGSGLYFLKIKLSNRVEKIYKINKL